MDATSVEIDLASFTLSQQGPNISLSVASSAFISGIPIAASAPDALLRAIEEERIWLASPGFCQVEVAVKFDWFSRETTEQRIEFLEFVATAVCQSPVSDWPLFTSPLAEL